MMYKNQTRVSVTVHPSYPENNRSQEKQCRRIDDINEPCWGKCEYLNRDSCEKVCEGHIGAEYHPAPDQQSVEMKIITPPICGICQFMEIRPFPILEPDPKVFYARPVCIRCGDRVDLHGSAEHCRRFQLRE